MIAPGAGAMPAEGDTPAAAALARGAALLSTGAADGAGALPAPALGPRADRGTVTVFVAADGEGSCVLIEAPADAAGLGAGAFGEAPFAAAAEGTPVNGGGATTLGAGAVARGLGFGAGMADCCAGN